MNSYCIRLEFTFSEQYDVLLFWHVTCFNKSNTWFSGSSLRTILQSLTYTVCSVGMLFGTSLPSNTFLKNFEHVFSFLKGVFLRFNQRHLQAELQFLDQRSKSALKPTLTKLLVCLWNMTRVQCIQQGRQCQVGSEFCRKI